MPEFRFYIDRKVSSWDRDEYIIDAEGQDEAIEYMKKVFKDELPAEDSIYPHDTYPLKHAEVEDMMPEQNDGQATQELILDLENGHDVPICDNAIPPVQNPHV